MKTFFAGAGTHVFWIGLIAAVYFVVAVFEIDLPGLTDKVGSVEAPPSSSVPVTNPLLDIPGKAFYDSAKPIVKAHPNGVGCAHEWERGDPGSLDCKVLAHKIAKAFGANSDDVINENVWSRYFVANSKFVTQSIINY